RFHDRFLLAFRTAPTHFASARTRIVVLGSNDREHWERETEITLPDSDLREPRFLAFHDRLWLFMMRAGSDPLAFAPKGIWRTERLGPANWSEPAAFWQPGYVPWRARVSGERAYLSVYLGAGLYTTADRPGEVRLLWSDDGEQWEPISAAPQITD